MCATCGCGQSDVGVKIAKPGEARFSLRNEVEQHSHHADVDHHDSETIQIEIEKSVLHENDMLAQRNRGFLEALNVFAINMVSSPGSGKTTLLEETIKQLKAEMELAVIEGDQQSMNDADRIARSGVPVVQVNTGKGCHLDARMVMQAIKKLNLKHNSLLLIENVGNLVCPAMFDLGENKRVVIISVTEGDDKAMKYPYMFESSQVCIINKIDLLPYVNFDIEKARQHALRINHRLEFFELSATTTQGMDKWLDWLKNTVNER